MKSVKLPFTLIVLFALMVGACKKDDSYNRKQELTLSFAFPDGIKERPTSVTITLTNQESGVKIVKKDLPVTKPAEILITDGIYSIQAEAVFGTGNQTVVFAAQADHVTLSAAKTVVMTLLPQIKGGIVIREAFFSSAPEKETGTPYMNGSYVILTNNSAETLYADSLVLAGAAANTSYEEPEVYAKHLPRVGINFIFMIPGRGKDHPLKPGEDLVLCMTATNHNTVAPLVPNLAQKAHFEWLEPQTDIKMLADNPQVPNMQILYQEAEFGPTMLINTMSLFIFKLGMPLEQLMKEHTISTPYANPEIPPVMLPYIPDTWMSDGVQIAEGSHLNQVALPVSVDRTHTYVRNVTKGFAVRRKVYYITGQRTVYQDTNDSMNDFERDVKSSLL